MRSAVSNRPNSWLSETRRTVRRQGGIVHGICWRVSPTRTRERLRAARARVKDSPILAIIEIRGQTRSTTLGFSCPYTGLELMEI